MIPAIIIIVMAFVWLIKETDFLRIRLETTAYQKVELANPYNKVKPELPEDTKPYKPTEFTPLDMPATSGNLNILCVRE